MNDRKRRRLEAKGWRVGSTEDFLGLSAAESSFIELKIALGRWLRLVRKDRELTQNDLASLLGSSQSRVAKMEGNDPEVTLDLLVRSLLALGVSGRDVGKIMAGEQPTIRAKASTRSGRERGQPGDQDRKGTRSHAVRSRRAA